MKKLIITTAIILGLATSGFADGGGLFRRGNDKGNSPDAGYAFTNGAKNGTATPMLPNHNESGNQPAPLGSGLAVLLGLGAAYAFAKKREE